MGCILPQPNSYIEVLTPHSPPPRPLNVTVAGDRPFKEVIK